jgi:hypothetical protein
MRTPSGHECRYYYEDFYRGNSVQECRLISGNPRSEKWEPRLCARCPVHGILRANACANMVIEGRVARRWFNLVHRVEVYAVCPKHQLEVRDPYVGCGHCHPADTLTLFVAQEPPTENP